MPSHLKSTSTNTDRVTHAHIRGRVSTLFTLSRRPFHRIRERTVSPVTFLYVAAFPLHTHTHTSKPTHEGARRKRTGMGGVDQTGLALRGKHFS